VSGIVCDTLLRVIRRGAGNESHDLQRDREAGSLDAADDLSRVLLHADKRVRCVAWSGAPATVRRQLQAFDALGPLRRFGSPTRGIEKIDISNANSRRDDQLLISQSHWTGFCAAVRAVTRFSPGQ
jgi:hypothetical protein